MKRTLLTLAAIGTLALTACSSPTAAPEPSAAHSPASTTATTAEATPAPTATPADDTTQEPAPEPSTAEESAAWPNVDDNEPMDGDTTQGAYDNMTVPQLLDILGPESETNYNECVQDAQDTADTGYTGSETLIELCRDLLIFEAEMNDTAKQHNQG